MTKSNDLVYWITERYSMALARAAGKPPPWSQDPHMVNVRYCNVHREDDRVTKWLAANWRSAKMTASWMVLGRMINYIPTLEEIRPTHFSADVKSTLKARRAKGAKVFTSAYTISTCGKPMDKIDYVVDWVCDKTDQLESYHGIDYSSLYECHKDLMQVDGLGSFLAAQVIADMKNTHGHPLEGADDWFEWSAPGPGSLNGLSEYFGHRVTPSSYQKHIVQAYEEVIPLLPNWVPEIHYQDFQNCLCEVSKFWRVNRGGHVRNKYDPYNHSPERQQSLL